MVQHTQYAIVFNAARQFSMIQLVYFCTMSSGLPGIFQDIARVEFHQGEILTLKSIYIHIRILYASLSSPLSFTLVFYM